MGKITRFLWNTPQLISLEGMNRVVSYLEQRNEYELFQSLSDKMPKKKCDDMPDDGEDDDEEMPCNPLPATPIQIGVVEVCGDLTYKPSFDLCTDTTSYLDLEEDVKEMLESGVKMLVMNYSSGGGEASHCFEIANNVRALADSYGVPIYAYVDECACSAAYAWAVIADEVYINPSAKAGSIGCVVCLLQDSEAMKMKGYKRIFITSGDNKVPFDEEGAFKKEFLDKIQKEVNKANDEFAAHVSKYSGLSTEAIKAMQAEVYTAEESLSKGLVNGVMTQNQFVDYITKKYEELYT